MGSRTSAVLRKNVTVINIAQTRVSINCSRNVSKFQNIGHYQRICPWEFVLALFHEKCDGHKLYEKSSFVRFFVHRLGILKILAIPNVLAQGNSYKHCFAKKRDDHKLCTKSCVNSSFVRFFMHRLGIFKYWPFPMYLPMGSHMGTVSRKNITVINFTQSYAQSRVSIDFSRIISKFQNTGHAQCIGQWEFRSVFHASTQNFKMLAITNVFAHGNSYGHGFVKKYHGHNSSSKLHEKLCFDRFFAHRLGVSKY
ncbi:hypothetical protein BHE74_00035266 [Ensete ventricosum]|nr:hypothetical protein GW17_00060583 [Ensete ventricosum]RWW57909.1 hypothetical protein BHE74_00035266 [Ensete ventricosum]